MFHQYRQHYQRDQGAAMGTDNSQTPSPSDLQGIRSTPNAGVNDVAADRTPESRVRPTAREAIPDGKEKMLWRREGETSEAKVNPPPGDGDS